MTKTSILISILLISFLGKAQVNGFTYARKLSDIKNEWHILELPDDFFAKVRPAFSDLRFIGITPENDTIEAPYHIRHRTKEVKTSELEYEFVNLVKTTRGFEYTFLFDSPQAINQINLSFSEANYDWEITVEGSKNGKQWTTVVEDYRLLKIKNSYTDYAFDHIDFNEVKYTYLRITIPLSANPVVISPQMIKRTVVEGKKKNFTVQNIAVTQDKTAHHTIIDFELPNAVPVSEISLSVKETFDYYRPIQIAYLLDSIVSEKGVSYTYRDVYRGMFSSLEKNEFDCSNTTSKKFRIILENGDNQPLSLDKISVNGYVYEAIIRFNEPATYYMAYGNLSVSTPSYDIAYFTDRIPENLQPIRLEKEVVHISDEVEITEPFFKSNWWLYGIMGVIVVLLGWFTLKMMRLS